LFYKILQTIDKYVFLLSLLTLPLVVLKLLGYFGLTWFNVFTPLLIIATWCVISVIAVGIHSGSVAVAQQRSRDVTSRKK
jgi:hypothetical protein